MNDKQRRSRMLRRILAVALCLSMLVSLPTAAVDYSTDGDDWGEEATESDVSDTGTTVDTSQEESNAAAEEEAARQEAQNQANKEKLESLQNDLEKLKEEQQSIQNNINSVQSQKKKEEAIKASLDADMDNLMAQMNILDDKIRLLNENIEDTENQISDTKKEINAIIMQLRKRMRESYKQGYSSPISVVLGADGYYDSLVRTTVIKKVGEYDNMLIEDLAQARAELEQQQKDLEADLEQLEIDKADYEEQKESVSQKIAQSGKNIEDIAKLEAEYLADAEEAKKKVQEMQAEIANVYASINTSSSADSSYVGGVMAWPLPGFSTISSSYGWRFNGSDFHTGVDITGSGCMGAPIVAANTGTVVKANTEYTPGRGYGIYVIVDHGGGMTTLYGHMSSLAVSEGQTVARGQTIGYVGSTGWSTGAHLHFEVRKDGNHTNPLAYIT